MSETCEVVHAVDTREPARESPAAMRATTAIGQTCPVPVAFPSFFGLELEACTRKLLVLRNDADFFQQVIKSFQTASRHVPELPLVQIPHRLIQRLQEFQTAWCNPGLYDAAVILLPFARDQSLLFQAIEKPRDVRVVRNHPFANRAAGQAFGSGAPQDTQHVVLRAGQVGGARQLLGFLAQGVSGLQQGEKDSFFQ